MLIVAPIIEILAVITLLNVDSELLDFTYLITAMLRLRIHILHLVTEARCVIRLPLLRNASLESLGPGEPNLALHIAVEHRQHDHIAVDQILMLSLLIEFVLHLSKLRKLIFLPLHI